MAIDGGYIKVWRQMARWEWYDDIPTCRLFLHLLLTVNYEDKLWHGIEISKGQRYTSIKKLAIETNLTEKQVRGAIEKLKSTGEIVTKRANQGTLITVENYTLYQDASKQEGERTASKRVKPGQSEGEIGAKSGQSQGDNGRKIKKDKESKKKDKEINNIYGELENVLLTDREYEQIVSRFPYDYQERINKLSVYIASTGKRYASHYATILNWARKNAEVTKRPENNPFL